MKFGLKLKKMSKDEQDEIAAKYLKAVGLDKFAKSFPKELSGGMKQRVAIARALLCRGRIMLLDEFTSALDAETESKLMDRLTENYTGKTLVFITHRKEIADRCDNVVRISRNSEKDEKTCIA